MRFLSWLITTAIALAVATWVMSGIYFDGPTSGEAQLRDKLGPLLVVALIQGVITSFVKPVLTFLSIPFIVLTLGLFLLVINALVLMLTAWVAGQFDGIDFHVTGFWPAVGGALIITVVTWLVDAVVSDDRR